MPTELIGVERHAVRLHRRRRRWPTATSTTPSPASRSAPTGCSWSTLWGPGRRRRDQHVVGRSTAAAGSRCARATRSCRAWRRRGIAMEPMTCPPNAFQTGEDVIRIEPGAESPSAGASSAARSRGSPSRGHDRRRPCPAGRRPPRPVGRRRDRRCTALSLGAARRRQRAVGLAGVRHLAAAVQRRLAVRAGRRARRGGSVGAAVAASSLLGVRNGLYGLQLAALLQPRGLAPAGRGPRHHRRVDRGRDRPARRRDPLDRLLGHRR